jgi:hypothetical protein
VAICFSLIQAQKSCCQYVARIIPNTTCMLAPSGRIVAFVVECSLEHLACAVVADTVLADLGHLSERMCLQTDTVLAQETVHVERYR